MIIRTLFLPTVDGQIDFSQLNDIVPSGFRLGGKDPEVGKLSGFDDNGDSQWSACQHRLYGFDEKENFHTICGHAENFQTHVTPSACESCQLNKDVPKLRGPVR